MTLDVFSGQGQGYRIANRLHVGGLEWNFMVATDYWFHAANTVALQSAATAVGALSSSGWVTTSVAFTNTATADFLSAADDTPTIASGDADLDILRSPIIFGNYAHGLAVSKILGYMPTKLCAEWYGAFATASANEAGTWMGFWAGTKSAAVYSDGTNFQMTTTTATDAGALISTTYHLWKIVVGPSTTEWFIDGVSQGTATTAADLWPASFGFVTSTTNRPAISWAHVWYE